MDISKLKRNPDAVKKTLLEKNNQLITKNGCKILIPAGYTSKGLANISTEVSILGIFAMTIDGNLYSVSKSTSLMIIQPDEIDNVMIEDDEYILFTFNPGSVVIKNTQLVRDKKIVNTILDYFVDYGHSPWFINYVDHCELFKFTSHFNDITIGSSQAVRDVITAHISRSPDNFSDYFRHAIKDPNQIFTRPTIIATRDISNNTTSNLARINGSELQRSLKSALLATPTKSEPLEQLLSE